MTLQGRLERSKDGSWSLKTAHRVYRVIVPQHLMALGAVRVRIDDYSLEESSNIAWVHRWTVLETTPVLPCSDLWTTAQLVRRQALLRESKVTVPGLEGRIEGLASCGEFGVLFLDHSVTVLLPDPHPILVPGGVVRLGSCSRKRTKPLGVVWVAERVLEWVQDPEDEPQVRGSVVTVDRDRVELDSGERLWWTGSVPHWVRAGAVIEGRGLGVVSRNLLEVHRTSWIGISRLPRVVPPRPSSSKRKANIESAAFRQLQYELLQWRVGQEDVDELTRLVVPPRDTSRDVYADLLHTLPSLELPSLKSVQVLRREAMERLPALTSRRFGWMACKIIDGGGCMTGGTTTGWTHRGGLWLCTVSDGVFAAPALIQSESTICPVETSLFTVRSVVVSCISLGPASERQQSSDLPPCEGKERLGAVHVVERDGCRFAVSIAVVGSNLISVQRTSVDTPEEDTVEYGTVRDHFLQSSGPFCGLLVRQQWRKSGLTLSVSHLPEGHVPTDATCCVQTLTVQPSIPQLLSLGKELSRVWRIGNTPTWCSLLWGGGWDDGGTVWPVVVCAKSTTPNQDLVVYPMLDVEVAPCRTLDDNWDRHGGGLSWLLGYLDRRPPRFSDGRLRDVPIDAGVEATTLGTLLLQPSLSSHMVYEIRQAVTLGIQYCQVTAECTHCYQDFRKDCNCRFRELGYKWECSTILDDGTGQAKLYAEREVAERWVNCRRKLVLEDHRPLIFSPTMPLPNDQSLHSQNLRLLYEACRRSSSTSVSYWVRCKPRSLDDVSPTLLQDTHWTWSLPPLQLNLVTTTTSSY